MEVGYPEAENGQSSAMAENGVQPQATAEDGVQSQAMIENVEGSSGVTEDGKECYICRDSFDSKKDTEELLAPCKCTGDIQFAHESCIQVYCNAQKKTICEACLETLRHPDGQEFEVQVPAPDPVQVPAPVQSALNAQNPQIHPSIGQRIWRMLRKLACCPAKAPVQDEPPALNTPNPNPAQDSTN